MEYLIVAVKDKVANKYMQPSYTENEDTAKRIFAYQLSKVEMWKENPEQFELYSLGKFNIETGEIEVNKDLICKGTDLLERS